MPRTSLLRAFRTEARIRRQLSQMVSLLKMKYACAIVFALCATSILVQVNCEGVTPQETKQVLSTLVKVMPLPRSILDKLKKSLPDVSVQKFSEVKDFLKENGFSSSQLSSFDKIVGDVLSAKDSKDWVAKAAALMEKLAKVPAAAIAKFKKIAPAKLPTDIADVKKLLKDAGFTDKQIDIFNPVMKWIRNLEYA